MQDLARHGFAHRAESPGEGDCADFCPACPQPGINIPSDWNSDPHKYGLLAFSYHMRTKKTRRIWLYTRSICADGNFKQEHLCTRSLEAAAICNGTRFLVPRSLPGGEKCEYDLHLEDRAKLKKKEVCIITLSDLEVVESSD